MRSDAWVVVQRLRARQSEIEDAIFLGVREAVPEPGGEVDTDYVAGLRTAVAAAVEFGFAGLERGEEPSGEIPAAAVAQARLAARSGVGLEAVLRRYIVGHALLWDFVMQEADRVERAGRASGLREMARAQAALLDQLVIGVTREHVAELQRAGRSREQRVFEWVRLRLASGGLGDSVSREVGELDPDYDLDGEHLGVIARGTGCEEAVRGLARALDRRVLCVRPGAGTVWAWLGGRQALSSGVFERALSIRGDRPAGDLKDVVGEGDVSFVVGEPARGLEGWRLTHRQAQAALLVSLRRPRLLTRYVDVALLAAALGDDTLAPSLTEIYLSPLEDVRGSGPVLREALRAYFAAERSASAAAVALKIARSTFESRLRTIEERLECSLRSCPVELEVASQLDALSAPTDGENITVGSDFI
jgi:hypothetical protein